MGERSRRDWNDWVDQHRGHLTEQCGVPLSVLEDPVAWEYFLENGYYQTSGSAEADVNVDGLSPDQALHLCLFLENDGRYESPGYSALNRLQFLLKRGKHREVADE